MGAFYMGLSDFMKKYKLNPDIMNSMDDYFRKQEKYRELKIGELVSLPDSQ